jgi:hypothetical protein
MRKTAFLFFFVFFSLSFGFLSAKGLPIGSVSDLQTSASLGSQDSESDDEEENDFSDDFSDVSSSSSSSDYFGDMDCLEIFEYLEEYIISYRKDFLDVACDTQDFLEGLFSVCDESELSADYIGCMGALRPFKSKVTEACEESENEESTLEQADDDNFEYILVYCGFGEDVVIIFEQEDLSDSEDLGEVEESTSTSEGISSVKGANAGSSSSEGGSEESSGSSTSSKVSTRSGTSMKQEGQAIFTGK